MGLFKFAKCGCVDNTAFGLFWSALRHNIFFDWTPETIQYIGKPLCSECASQYFSDGKRTRYGKWHGKFPKQQFSELTIEQQKDIYTQ